MRNSADTNWNSLKHEKCYSSKYIGQILGVDTTTVNSWLGGRTLPNNIHMEKLCDLFGIDQSTGRKIFEADRNGVKLDISTIFDNVVVADTSMLATTKTPVSLKVILSKFIDYEVDPSAIYMFLTAYKQCAEDTDAVLLNIYGKIEATDYQKIYQIVGLGM